MEEITEENFKKILKERHPKIFGIADKKEIDELNDKLNCKDQIGQYENKPYFSISCSKGWFYLLDAVFDLLEDHNVEISDIKEKYGLLTIYLSGDIYSDDVTERAEVLSSGICEMCGRKIEAEKIKKDNEINESWIYTRCKICSVDPREEFPMAKDHMPKEEIIKYLTDDKYFYTTVEDFEKMIKDKTNDKKIINLKGSAFQDGKNYYFEDETGIMQLEEDGYDFLGKVNLINVYPVFKNGKTYINFKLAQG
jgi:hypothetical protein